MVNGSMVIDAHTHVNWHGYNPEKLVASMDEMGIDMCWLLTWEANEREFAHTYDDTFTGGYEVIPVEGVWEAIEQYPDRFVPGYAPDPKSPNAIEKLKRAAKQGIRVSGEHKFRTLLDDPDAIRFYRVCGELGLPVTFHLDVPYLPPNDPTKPVKYWYHGDLGNVERTLRACPDTVFLGHAPGFWREVSGDADTCPDAYPKGAVVPGGRLAPLFDRYTNLYGDLSAGSGLTAISRDSEWGRKFLLDYQDRLLFARDFFDDGHMNYLKSLDLPQEAWEKIMSGNALRLVPLD
jgi:predicted TIM-barrel fold metal-dependent hydrolase